MSENLSKLLSLLNRAATAGKLRRVIFSRGPADAPRRTEGRVCLFRGEAVLATEASFADGKVLHTRHPLPLTEEDFTALLSGFRQVNLLTGCGDAEYKRSAGGRDILRVPDGMASALSDAGVSLPAEALDRKKEHILTGDEPFLRELEIADKNGRIHDKRQPKFRQINRFLEHLRDIEEFLPREDPLLIYDLCCGKSYLSFAVYHYFSVLRGRQVDMLCLDRKTDVIDFCREAAGRLGFDGMRFLAEDVRKTPAGHPGLLISLHACDTATDLVLETGIRLGAEVILSTPCCHRTLSRHLSCPALDFAAGQPQLRQKLSEALTDGLRSLHLAEKGYRVTATELTDPDDTPKNTLLRAVRDRAAGHEARAEKAAADYRAALTFLFGEEADGYLSALL